MYYNLLNLLHFFTKLNSPALVMYESTHPFHLFECGRSDEERETASKSDFLKNAPSQNEMADNDNDGNGATFLVRQ